MRLPFCSSFWVLITEYGTRLEGFALHEQLIERINKLLLKLSTDDIVTAFKYGQTSILLNKIWHWWYANKSCKHFIEFH